MKTQLKRTAFIAAACLIGCVPSLHSIYTDKDIVFLPEILGSWTQVKSENTWEFTRRDENNYSLNYMQADGRAGEFVAHVAEIEGVRFLDLFPEKQNGEKSGFYQYHFVPIHTIYLIEGTSPQIKLAALDLKWLNGNLDEHPDALPHTTVNGQKLLTASTAELQAFLLKHRDKFTGRFELERKLGTASR